MEEIDGFVHVKYEWNRLISADNSTIEGRLAWNKNWIDDSPNYNKNYVRGKFLIIAGKWHFSIKINSDSSEYIQVGLASAESYKQASYDKDGWVIYSYSGRKKHAH